jgi:hypothetical protein
MASIMHTIDVMVDAIDDVMAAMHEFFSIELEQRQRS